MATKKKVAKRTAPRAETVRHEPPAATPQTDSAEVSKNPTIEPDKDRKIARLLQRLMSAEEEAASFAAIADALLEEKNALAVTNRRLTETLRQYEEKAFSEEPDEDDEEAQE